MFVRVREAGDERFSVTHQLRGMCSGTCQLISERRLLAIAVAVAMAVVLLFKLHTGPEGVWCVCVSVCVRKCVEG